MRKTLCIYIGVLLLWLPLVLTGQSRDSIPEGTYRILGINVKGSKVLSAGTIANVSGLYVGKTIRIPGNEITDALRRLWEQELFEEVSIEAEKIKQDGIYLLIKLKERPRISKYTFVGITKSQATDIREKINFIRGTVYTQTKKLNAQRIIKNYFQEKGYYNVKTEFEEIPDTAFENGMIIRIIIRKGKKTKIRKIHFVGTQKLNPKVLRRKLKKTKQKFFGRIWKASKLIPADFAKDKELLYAYMQAKGLRDAKILGDSIVKVSDNLIDLYIKIYEGRTYYIGNIRWTGNTKYDDAFLSKILGVEKGDVYNKALLEKRLYMNPTGGDVSSLYLDDGHLFFRVEPVETKVYGDTIDLELRIYEGPQARINKVIVKGNTKTHDRVIIRELRTLPGNKFSRADLIRSQREIANLGYFDPQNMNINPVPNVENGTVDIIYEVTEKPSDQIFLQGGWGGRQTDITGTQITSGLLLTLGLTLNNFSTRKLLKPKEWNYIPVGDGQKLSLSIQASGTGFQNYGISFTEPWLGGKKPTSLGFRVNYSIQKPWLSNYYISIFNTSIDLGQRMKFPDDFFRSYTSLNYRYYVARNAYNIFAGFSDGFINIFSVRQVFDRTSIDAPIFPRSGSSLNFSIEATPPYSLFLKRNYAEMTPAEKYNLLEFHKWTFEAKYYVKVYKNFVIAPRVLFGYLGGYTKELGISPFERFYLGGDGIQNFNLDGRTIHALRGYSQPYIGSPYGSVVFDKFTLDFRQAITLSAMANVWVHAFFEAGNAWSDAKDFNPFVLRRSVGAGIRVMMPMFGLLGVDYGYGIDDVYYGGGQLNGGIFHFMIGQEF